MHYQLFIPHETGKPLGTAQQALERVGLADLIPGHEGRDSQGPGEASQGHLIAWRRPGKNDRMHFNASEQTWIPAIPNGPDGEGRGRYWVGFWNDSPIVPEDLQLPQATWGATYQLGDGNVWVIPTLRSFNHDIVRNAETGEWETTVQARYHKAHFGAMYWAERLQNEPEVSASWGELADYVESVLRLNYRLIPEVTNHLRLFSTHTMISTLYAVIGIATQEA